MDNMFEFKLGSFPIRLHWSYLLLIILVVGAGFGVIGILIWLIAVLVAILIHELAHGIMARRRGALLDHVMLYGLGGVTVWNERYGSGVNWKSRIWIAAAGPVTGLGLGLLGYAGIRFGLFGEAMQSAVDVPWRLGLRYWAIQGDWLSFAIACLVWMSLAWAVINLLPMGGLDGSQILAEVLERKNPRDGRKQAAWVGVIVAGVAAIYAVIVLHSWLIAFVFGMFALNDYARVNDQPPPFGNFRR